VKRFALVMGVVFFAVLLSTTGNVFAGAQDFTLVNYTGHDITAIYVSPSWSNSWQENILSSGVLDNGYKIPITFNSNVTSTHWDLKVVFTDGTTHSWLHFNLRRISRITLNQDTTASYE